MTSRISTAVATVAACLLASAGLSGCARAARVIPYDEYLSIETSRVVATMTLDEKASQVLMTGISGNERFAPWLREYFRDTVPGAVLLFKYNIAETPEGVHGYVSSCEEAFESMGSPVPPAFAIDHEGGDVYRTGAVTSRLPSARLVATHLKPAEAERLYDASARQLSLLGISMNLGPIAETLNDENGAFLGTRSWSSSQEQVAEYAQAAVRGFREGGMVSAVKHFPGTGKGDPHSGDSIMGETRKELESGCIATFRKVLAARPAAIVVSHCVVPSVDPDTPFCVSEKGVRGILRGELKYDGVVVTDDIAMKALTSRGFSSGAAAVRAIRAGCDMVMTSDRDIKAVRREIALAARGDPAFAKLLDQAVSRIVLMKFRAGIAKTALRRYAESRATGEGSLGRARAFDASSFLVARLEGDRILGEMHGN